MNGEADDDLLAPLQRQIEKVPFDGKVAYVRQLNVDEQIEFEAECSALDKDDSKGYMAVSLAFYVCRPDGTPRYTLAEARERIGAADKSFVKEVLSKAQVLNKGLTPDAVEDAAKNY